LCDDPKGSKSIGGFFNKEGFLREVVRVGVTVIYKDYFSGINVREGAGLLHLRGEDLKEASWLTVLVIDIVPVHTVCTEDGTVFVGVLANSAVYFFNAVHRKVWTDVASEFVKDNFFFVIFGHCVFQKVF
jgi:hypothetical protein